MKRAMTVALSDQHRVLERFAGAAGPPAPDDQKLSGSPRLVCCSRAVA
jgi:hypothetical protein